MLEPASPAAAPPTVSIDEQIAAVRRELAMRRNVYRKWVTGGRMKQEVADKEIAAMEAVLATLQRVRERENHG